MSISSRAASSARARLAFVAPLEPRRLLANVPVVIDLLAVFTPAAVAEVGSEALLRSRLSDSVDATNRAMSNSRIGVSVRLVGVEPVNYTGTNNLFDDRTNLTAGAGGLAAAKTLRNSYGADLVTLIVENDFGGGNGSLMTSTIDPTNAAARAFTAISADSIGPFNYTLAHELGHNLGAGHERGNTIDPAVGPFSYSYGYRFTAEGRLRHDLMSYDPGAEVPYYANPAVSFRGAPTGSPIGAADEADLAATFAQTAPIVAAYRAAAAPDTLAPTASVDAIRVRGGFAYVTIRYADDGGIDLATIGTNDLSLTVPGLATPIVPVPDSIENAGVGGAFSRATYRAYLRDVPTTPAAITVAMSADAVRDVAGNAVPAAAALPTSTAWAAGFSYDMARDLGALAAGEALLVADSLADQSSDDVYRFTLSAAATISTRLTGLAQDGNVFIARDANGDGVYQFDELIDGSFRAGTQDDTFSLNLAAGTYFAWVFGTVVTPYALQLSSYVDAIAPTAQLDATDVRSAATQFVFNVAFDDDVEVNALSARFDAPVRVTNPFGGFYIAFPAWVDLDVNGPRRVATYRINAGFTLSASDNGVYTVALEPPDSPIFSPPLARFVRDGAGNRVAAGTPIGTFRVAIGQADVAAPTLARVDAPTVHRGGATAYEFDVTFADNVGVTTASLAASEVRVVGPDGVERTATAINVGATPAVGSRRTVRYRLGSLPGGAWDFADTGSYALTLVAGTVSDAANNAAGTLALGTFAVGIPLPGDANRDGTVNFTDLLALAQNYGTTARTFAQGNFDDDAAGDVNFSDLLVLAQRYGTSRVATEARPATKSSRGRVASEVLA